MQLFCNWHPANTNDFFINTACKKPKIILVAEAQFLIKFSADKEADINILSHQKTGNLCLPYWVSFPFIGFFLVLCILILLSSHAAQLLLHFSLCFSIKVHLHPWHFDYFLTHPLSYVLYSPKCCLYWRNEFGTFPSVGTGSLTTISKSSFLHMPFDMSCVWWNFDLKDLYVFFPLSWTPIINITQNIPRLLSGLPNNEQFQYVHQFAAFLKHNVKGKCAISYLKQKRGHFFLLSRHSFTFLLVTFINATSMFLNPENWRG